MRKIMSFDELFYAGNELTGALLYAKVAVYLDAGLFNENAKVENETLNEKSIRKYKGINFEASYFNQGYIIKAIFP